MDPVSLFGEFKRRRVFRALIGYGIASFAVLQVSEPVIHALHLPEWTLSFMVVALGAGFPIVVVLAWAFDVSSSGVERTAPAATAGGLKGARLALVLVGLGLAAAAPGILYFFAIRGGGHSASQGTKSTDAVPRSPSVAVLPFADMSPAKDQEYLSDGIAEEILNSLAQIEGLRVIGRTSSFSFKGKNEDLRGIGEKLGVAHLLEGSIRRAGARIRVTAQLVEASGGSHLWSQAYDRELTDIFALQQEIANAVVAALEPRLLKSGDASTQRHRAINPEAYRQFLLAKQFSRRRVGVEDHYRSMEAYEKAIALDPAFAPAWAGLADTHRRRALFFSKSLSEVIEHMELASSTAEKAVALDPALADAYRARGDVRSSFKWDWAGGRADLEHALQLKPGDPEILADYAGLLAYLGTLRLQEAIDARRKAAESDPLDSGHWFSLSQMYAEKGEFELAHAAMDRVLEISPENPAAHCQLGFISLLERHPATALESYGRCSFEWWRFPGIAMAQHDLGRPDESQKALETTISRFAGIAALQVAEVYAWREEADHAFEWLQRAYDQRDSGLGGVKTDALLRKLHGDPRYNAFLKKLNLPLD